MCRVCAVAGLAGWGRVVDNGDSIYLVCFLWGLMLFGMTAIASFCTQWALDAYRQHSTELFIMNVSDWITHPQFVVHADIVIR